MELSRVFFLVYGISMCLYFVSTQARLHNYTELNHRIRMSLISQPPSPPPESANPISGGNSSSFTGIFDVRPFGAVGDGISDDTEAFKMAWDAACQVESAILLVPNGYSFMIQSAIFTGPCQNNFVFQIDGTLMPPNGPDSWPQNDKRQWLVFYRINGMSLQGGGLIEGRGEKWWNLPCKPHKGNGTTLPGPCDSPVAIWFFMSSNLTVHGLRIQNSPQFHFRFDGCRSVHIDGITIKSPPLSPNTDGIHLKNTDSVGIYNSVISSGMSSDFLIFPFEHILDLYAYDVVYQWNLFVGDDCISIGAGCYNVEINNITCGPSHGISIGSLGNHNLRDCVSNITVTNSVIKHSDNGVRIKTWQGGSGLVTGVTFNNVYMDTVRNPIIIDQFYCLTKACTNATTAVFVSDISYTDIKGTYDVSRPPIHFACSDSVPCTNITLSDVELLPAKGEIVLDPFCWNAYGDSHTLTIPPVYCLLEGIPQLIVEMDIDQC
ncbi:hypothetical protein NE237_014802 [Protea cynaroides]|uniref:Polygalacturonase n=1 Tax=Protea cynaroides TaxID=273540 RepID=A0A9Q0KD12_9MAGN|nr:hypothetical protein NE237_014802 [Protea cynaroides]